MLYIRCDLLEKSYFCSITNSLANEQVVKPSVVICLKNRTFAVSQTAVTFQKNQIKLLWFAWKIVLLQYHKQRSRAHELYYTCCDLLEKSYFCSITNSIIIILNRFKVLWFAWKIVLLQYHKQLSDNWVPAILCCDLLEKSYFCSITNSYNQLYCDTCDVVICLKNRTFAVSQTAYLYYHLDYKMLWFAWKIVLLQYHKQQKNKHNERIKCCDLLEKSYFCSITNSIFKSSYLVIIVVICLKNRTFAVSQTAGCR